MKKKCLTILLCLFCFSVFSQQFSYYEELYVGSAGINNVAAAGAVVDWIQVEEWQILSPLTKTVLEEKSLLLRTDTNNIVRIN